ncbi:MAG: DUF1667 domain-containing protein [Ruminiclostridium sp.]|nr:DUF1667 domain-containing protein [Ruminiclostridium sp.]
MTRELICIGCPMGCELTAEVEDGKVISVTGNTCGVGKKYAETEITAPVRTVTSTVMSDKGKPVPVKSAGAVPKDKIFDVMKDIKSAVVTLPVKIGDVAVTDAAGTGVDIIVTKESF